MAVVTALWEESVVAKNTLNSRRRCPINVFRYRDYRLFLADYHQAKKARGFSYREGT